MQILLVEDEAPKRKHILHFLSTVAKNVVVVEARSVNSALDQIDATPPDLLLLDMSLPTFDVGERESGGRPQGFGGIEVLRQLSYAGVKFPVIVITGYEAFLRETGKPLELSELRANLAEEFPEVVIGVLHYDSTFDEWQRELEMALGKVGIELRDVK